MTEMTFREYHERQQLLMEAMKPEEIKNNLKDEKDIDKSIQSLKAQLNKIELSEDEKKEILGYLNEIKVKGKANSQSRSSLDDLIKILSGKEEKTSLESAYEKQIAKVKDIDYETKEEWEKDKKALLSFINHKDSKEEWEKEINDLILEKGKKFEGSADSAEEKDQPAEEKEDLETDYKYLYNHREDLDRARTVINNNKKYTVAELIEKNKEEIAWYLMAEIACDKFVRATNYQDIHKNPPVVTIGENNFKLQLADNQIKAYNQKKPNKPVAGIEDTDSKSIFNFVSMLNNLHGSENNSGKLRKFKEINDYITNHKNLNIDKGTLSKIMSDIDTIISKPGEDNKLKDGDDNNFSRENSLKPGNNNPSNPLKPENSLKPGSGNGNQGKPDEEGYKPSNPDILTIDDITMDTNAKTINQAISNTFGNKSGTDKGYFFFRVMKRAQQSKEKIESKYRKDVADREVIDKSKYYNESFSPIFNELLTNPLLKEEKEIIFERINLDSETNKNARDSWDSLEDELENIRANYSRQAYDIAKKIDDHLGISDKRNYISKLKGISNEYVSELNTKASKIIKKNDYGKIGRLVRDIKDIKSNRIRAKNRVFDDSTAGNILKADEARINELITPNNMKKLFSENNKFYLARMMYGKLNMKNGKQADVRGEVYDGKLLPAIVQEIIINNFDSKIDAKDDPTYSRVNHYISLFRRWAQENGQAEPLSKLANNYKVILAHKPDEKLKKKIDKFLSKQTKGPSSQEKPEQEKPDTYQSYNDATAKPAPSANQEENGEERNQQNNAAEEKKKSRTFNSFISNLMKSGIEKRIARSNKKIEKLIHRQVDDEFKLKDLNNTNSSVFTENILLNVPILEDDEQEVQVRTADAEKAVLMALSMDQQTSAQGKRWIVDNMYKGNPEAEKLIDEFIKNNTKSRAKADQALRAGQKVAPGPGGNPVNQTQNGPNDQQSTAQPADQGQQQAPAQPGSQLPTAQPGTQGQQQQQAPQLNNQQPTAQPGAQGQQVPAIPTQATVTTAAADGYPNRLYKKLIRRKIGM